MNTAVQQTDYDALSCKVSAISKHYLPCPRQIEECGFRDYSGIQMEYIRVLRMLSRRAYGKISRAVSSTMPVMNYGTYLRTVSIDLSIEEFMRKHQDEETQILNLGSGSDLRMIQLLARFPKTTYIDLDFQESVKLKAKVLRNSDQFVNFFQLNSSEGEEINTGRYKLLTADLKDVPRVLELLSRIASKKVPTLILTECVLCYIPQAESQQLIDSVAEYFTHGKWVSYDPIGGNKVNDRFGTIMQDNLRESRHLEMPTLMIYNSPESYALRLKNISHNIHIQIMWDYYMNEVSDEEKNRLKALQFLDEIEELEIMLSHYILLEATW